MDALDFGLKISVTQLHLKVSGWKFALSKSAYGRAFSTFQKKIQVPVRILGQTCELYCCMFWSI